RCCRAFVETGERIDGTVFPAAGILIYGNNEGAVRVVAGCRPQVGDIDAALGFFDAMAVSIVIVISLEPIRSELRLDHLLCEKRGAPVVLERGFPVECRRSRHSGDMHTEEPG